MKRFIPTVIKRPFGIVRAAIRRRRRLSAVEAPQSTITAVVSGKRVLFFAPEAGIRPYVDILTFVARTLKELGHSPVYVRCFDLFARCPVKDMNLMRGRAVRSQMLDACLDCFAESKDYLSGRGIEFHDLREYLDGNLLKRVRTDISRLKDTDLLDYSHRGVNVGRLAYYDFALAMKHSLESALSSDESVMLREYIASSVLAIEAFSKIHERTPIDAVVAFDAYGMASSVKIFARSLGIPSKLMTVPYHLNGDWRRVLGMSDYSIVYEQRYRASWWAQFRDVPLPKTELTEIMNDLIHRMTGAGAHIYSPNKTNSADELRQRLGLSKTKKTLVAYTSSRDEHDAILVSLKGMGYPPLPVNDAFADTFAWLDDLIDYINRNPQYQLVIRIHPRVGATSRDGHQSRDAEEYRRRYSKTTENVAVVWYDDRVSSYDLAELADLALISWSSIGLELARMGIPVLGGLRSVLTLAPDDATFIRQASDRAEYFRKLEAALGEPPSAQALLMAYRWYYLFYLGNSVDLSDVRPHVAAHADDSANYKLPMNARLVEEIFVNQGNAVQANLDDLQREGRAQSPDEERRVLTGQLGRLTHFLFTGIDSGEACELVLRDRDVTPTRSGEVSRVGDEVLYFHEGEVIRRDTILFRRLFELIRELQANVGVRS